MSKNKSLGRTTLEIAVFFVLGMTFGSYLGTVSTKLVGKNNRVEFYVVSFVVYFLAFMVCLGAYNYISSGYKKAKR